MVTGVSSAQGLLRLQENHYTVGISRSMFQECDEYYKANGKIIRKERSANKRDKRITLREVNTRIEKQEKQSERELIRTEKAIDKMAVRLGIEIPKEYRRKL